MTILGQGMLCFIYSALQRTREVNPRPAVEDIYFLEAQVAAKI
jgi:hypothetical protein